MVASRPWLAALLSLIETPLGLFYAGRPSFAVAYWLTVQIAYVVISVAVATGKLNAPVLLTTFLAFLLLRLAVPITAWRTARHAPEGRRWFQRWPGLLLIFVSAVAISTGIQTINRAFVLEAFRVPGRSMASTINHQDRIFVDKLFTRAVDLRRGDLVLYRTAPEGTIRVGRLMALEGDTISLREQTLLVNGEVIKEPYASYREVPYPLPELTETTVPPNHFYVLGDNRNFSNDSRTIGPIALADYYGRPTNIFFSRHYESVYTDESGTVHTPGPIAWERIGKRLAP